MNPDLIIRLTAFALINMFLIVAGYSIAKRGYKVLSWALFVVSIAIVYLLFAHQHPILKMLVIIATTFTAMKLVAVSATYPKVVLKLSFKQWLFFAGAWAGMRPQPFETLGGSSLQGGVKMVRFGISRIILGALLIWFTRLLNHYELILDPVSEYVVITVLLLVGFSLVLHFGILSISAGMWRLQGTDTYYLFRRPATALSLTEFWGKRWNLAFSEMTSVAIFRPLKQKVGNGGALLISFIFSGLLHELALSVPVNAGYGLPTLYFVIHALVVMLERYIKKYHPYFLSDKFVARVWVFFWLVVPAPLLFHHHFIDGILRPMAGL